MGTQIETLRGYVITLQQNLSEQQSEKEGIYNQEALHDKLEEIMWEGADFLDTQATTSSKDEPIQDIEDDLQRELVFYNQVNSTQGCKRSPERCRGSS